MCVDDIKVYAKVRSEQKLFQFLHGLDRKFDPIKRDILRLDTLPTAETAYATVRKEAAHQNILGATTTESHGIATGLVAGSGEKDGVGLSGRGYRRNDGKKPFIKEDKSHLTCEECGMSRHTKEQCFRIVGYPDWWTKRGKNPKLKKKTPTSQPSTSKGPGGLAAAAAGGPEGSGGSSFSMEGAAQTYGDRPSDSWIFDCGATDTMTYDVSDFVKMTRPMKTHIETANGGKMGVKNGGTIKFNRDIKLHKCLYVPSLSHKLLSISHVTKELNCSALMHPTFCLLQDIKTGRIIGRGTEKHGLYYVDEVTQSGIVMLAHGTMERKAWLWHRRLGHPSGSYLHTLFPELFPLNKSIFCETCILAKSHRKSFKHKNTRVDTPFQLIHSDVWGPAPVIGGQNFKFYVIFVDDCTRMTWIYFLKNKSEVFDKFISFFTMIQTQFKKPIQIVRSDNGGEYVNSQMKSFFQSKGIVHQTTCPHTPEQNGVAERKNRILLEMTRALIIESHVPKMFWPEALATSTYLLNRLPTKILDLKTPLDTLEKFTEIPPTLTLQPKCVFVGYGVNQKGYRCYNPKTRRMFTSMNCDFLETQYFYSYQHSGQGGEVSSDSLSWLTHDGESCSVHSTTPLGINDTSATQDDLSHLISKVNNSEPSEPQTVIPPLESVESVESIEPEQQEIEEAGNQEPLDQEQPTQYTLPARANRGVPAKRYSPEQFSRGSRYPMANIANGCLSTEAKAFSASLYLEKIPSSTEEALDSENWKGAMDEEMDALRKNETWEKCSLPTGKKPVGCRWIFTVKYKPDGKIDRYKARLVAKGYTQTYGIDYSETFSPVAKIDTIRVLFSIASNQGWPLHQFDVKNAFLHGDLKEEVYMEAPPGFSDSFKTGEVCRLKKSLYGLKQSPRAWFGRFTLAMKKYGFKQSNSDHTLFLKHRQCWVFVGILGPN
ncbi:hypothetical protein OSB04_005940 [Centaurea solstitialis]|uniref:Integrase catalytic domain-containing protein n=1 Tax=Centaurea solstitialis TaxID=347529 RepID=A0AA38WQ15_9ASTR|nr:hypothetical protein OSB04_005940 [Centaurea solstitialis]